MSATPWISSDAAYAGSAPPLALAPPPLEDPAVASLVVARWFRYGKRRLYVKTAEGAEVGWADVDTGDRTLAMPELQAAFDEAVSLELAVLPPDYVPRRVLEEAPPSIAPRRAVIVPESSSPPPPVPAEVASVVMPPPFPRLTWSDLVVDGPEAAAGKSVGARLEELRAEGWQVLHSVPIGTRGRHIDHVLIGPGGVFVVNSETDPHPHLRSSLLEADRATKFLSGALGWPVLVTPAVVFLTDTVVPQVTIKDTPDGVVILDRLDLPRYFRNRQPRLSAAEVDEVFEYARRSSTWS